MTEFPKPPGIPSDLMPEETDNIPPISVKEGTPESTRSIRQSLFPSAKKSMQTGRELNRLPEWMQTLTEYERVLYDDLGYKIQILHAMCSSPNLIALPNDNKGPDQINISEVIDLFREIHDDTKELLDQKPVNYITKGCRSLCSGLIMLSAKKDISPDYRLLLFAQMCARIPNKIRKIVIPSTTDQTKKHCKDIARRYLFLSDNELQIFIEALELIKEVYENLKDKNQTLSQEDLELILEKLQQIPVFKDLFIQKNKPSTRGLYELDKLRKFMKDWGNLFVAVTKVSPAYQRQQLEDHTAAFTHFSPHDITPLISYRHRELREQRLEGYEKLAEIVDNISDNDLKKKVKRIVLQISTILSYLDYMWGMHDETEEEGNKRIILPKRMFLLYPLVCNELRHLIQGLEKCAEQTQENGSLVAFSPKELDNLEDSQADFRLPEDEPSLDELRDDIGSTLGKVFTESIPPTDEKASQCFGELSFILGNTLSNVIKDIRGIQTYAAGAKSRTYCETIDNPEDDNDIYEIEVTHDETLSYHVQDFVTELYSTLMIALTNLARTFDKKGEVQMRRDIIPEYIDYEKQRAKLRQDLITLEAETGQAKTILDGIQIKEPVEKSIEALRSAADAIDIFQTNRDNSITKKEYYGVLKGEEQEKIDKFSEAIKEFFLNRDYTRLDVETMATFTLIRDLETFQDSLPVLDEKDNPIAAWSSNYRELKRLQQEIQIGYSNGGVKPDVITRYKQLCCQLLEEMKKIAGMDGINGCREKFERFLEEHPHAANMTEENFNDQFFVLQKIMYQFENFHNTVSYIRANITKYDSILTEHDWIQARQLENTIEVLITTLESENPDSYKSPEVETAISKCQRIIPHFEPAAPDLTEILKLQIDSITQMEESGPQSVVSALKSLKKALQERFVIVI